MPEQVGKSPTYRQAKAEAFLPVTLRIVQLYKFLKYFFLLILRDSHAGIRNPHEQLPRSANLCSNSHLTRLSVLNGIGDQVSQDIPQQNRVAANSISARFDTQFQSLCLCHGSGFNNQAIEQCIEREVSDFGMYVARIQARYIK